MNHTLKRESQNLDLLNNTVRKFSLTLSNASRDSIDDLYHNIDDNYNILDNSRYPEIKLIRNIGSLNLNKHYIVSDSFYQPSFERLNMSNDFYDTLNR